MRDIFFVTKEPMNIDDCYKEISKIYKKAKKYDDEISILGAPKSAFMWFPSLKKYDPSEYWGEDQLKDIPKDYNYFTTLNYHLTCVTKNFVRALQTLYPDMLIQDAYLKVYKIEEYLNCKFDH